MTDKSMEKLRSLLKSYQERTAKTQVAVKPVHDEGERRRRACGDCLQKLVRPALQSFVTELESAGHDASIQDHTDSVDAYPSVALSVAPRAPGATALASVLTFRYDPRRGIAVQRDVKVSAARDRVVTATTDRIGTIGVEAVTVEWVETKTLSFIEAVLKAN
ncbi:MAG TPA: hypothetical protein VEM13_06710 [Gemmatimonadales bacterium]|nr:hypothetical protein [Gemmatimonadales bacterium]